MGIYRPKLVNVIGSGFAGIECALFLAGHGIKVHLFNVETERKDDDYVDFVEKIQVNPSKKRKIFEDVLLRELEMLGSPLVRYAIKEKISFERENYKELIRYGREMIDNNENINVFPISINQINPSEVTVIATGNHTNDKLMDFLIYYFGYMNCFKKVGIFPIFTGVNEKKLYPRGDDENRFYLPLTYERYIRFINLIKYYSHQVDENFVFEENTMEWFVNRGRDDLRNFAMRQVYVEGYDEKPYAVMRIKKTENGYRIDDLYSTFSPEIQEDIFRSLEPLKDAKLFRKADVVSSCLLNSKFIINEFSQSVKNENLFFAGSILGIDGALDNIATGLVAGININKYFNDYLMEPMPENTCIGSIMKCLTSLEEVKTQMLFEDYKLIKRDENLNDKNVVKRLFETSKTNLEKFKEKYKNGKRI